jgi:hypothetical protein
MKVSCSVLSVLVLFSLMGCTTLVTIKTSVPGANVQLNSRSIGETPVSAVMSNALWDRQLVVITKKGYQPVMAELEQEFKVRAVIAGLFVWPLWFWAYGPAPNQYFVLEPN